MTAKSIAFPSWAGVDAYEVTVGRPPSMDKYLQSQVNTTTASLKRLRTRTSVILSAPSCSFFELFELTNDWSFVVQEMSVLWRPGLHLTAKPFADDWAASAKLMALIAALIMFMPGQPLLHLRARGSPRSWKHPYRVLECSSNFAGNKDLTVFTQASWKLRNAPASDALLDELWLAALRLGGVLVGSNDHLAGVSIGHLGFITAWRGSTGERVFLLSDPEYACYKLLSFEQMQHFISHPPHSTDFLVID